MVNKKELSEKIFNVISEHWENKIGFFEVKKRIRNIICNCGLPGEDVQAVIDNIVTYISCKNNINSFLVWLGYFGYE